MIYFIIFIIVTILVVGIDVYKKRNSKLTIEFEKKILGFQEQLTNFSYEYTELLKHFVEGSEEDSFLEKWKELYDDIQKCKIKTKSSIFPQITKFKDIYKNCHKYILLSNNEIRRKEIIKNLAEEISNFFIVLIKRKGKNGHWFSGCTNYPYCEYKEEIKKD